MRLPAGRRPQVTGEGIRQRVRDVPDELVLAVAYHAHGVVHLNFVEGMAGADLIPADGIFLGEDRHERASMKFVRPLFGAASGLHGGQHGHRRLSLGVVSAGEVEERRSDIYKGQHRVVRVAAFFLIRVAHNERHAQAAFVHGGFAAGKGHAVIAGKENQGVLPLAVFLEDLHQPTEALIHARSALVILRKFRAGFWCVREELRHGHLGRIIKYFLHAWVRALVGLVAEPVGLMLQLSGAAAAAMGIAGGVI